jgi:hypothetical protein
MPKLTSTVTLSARLTFVIGAGERPGSRLLRLRHAASGAGLLRSRARSREVLVVRERGFDLAELKSPRGYRAVGGQLDLVPAWSRRFVREPARGKRT